MQVTPATPSDLEQAIGCLTPAFAQDPITGFLLGTGSGYPERLAKFFSLLMRARMALNMPVLVARELTGICGAAMGNTTLPPAWPADLEEEWSNLETVAPGFNDRGDIYEAIAKKYKPLLPHYYLGVIGISPVTQGQGIGRHLLRSFCELSASDQESKGVYLETANPSNVRFYERAGFEVTGQGRLGAGTLWCMFLSHRPHQDA